MSNVRLVLKIEGVTGTSTVPGHEGWIDAASYQWGTGRGISSPRGTEGERKVSSASVSEISMSRLCDASSVELFKLAFLATPLPKVTIRLVDTEHRTEPVRFEVTLTEVYLSGLSCSMDLRSQDARDVESFSWNYGTIAIRRPGASEAATYDLTSERLA